MGLWLQVLASLGPLLLVRTTLRVQKLRRSINYYPSNYFLFGLGNRIVHTLFAPVRWLTHGANLDFLWKYTEFERLGVDVHATISLLSPVAVLGFKVADPETIKQITAPRAPFRKPAEKYRPLSFFGANIVASDGAEWRKYKKIVAPAFSENNNKLIWDTSVRIMLDLFEDVWGDQKTVTVDHGAELTLAMTLLILGSGVFGMETNWNDRALAPAGHKITFQESLRVVASNIKAKVVLPKWVYGMSAKLQAIDVAFNEMEAYMQEMIRHRISSTTQHRHDLLSTLIECNKQEDAASALDDRELMGEQTQFDASCGKC